MRHGLARLGGPVAVAGARPGLPLGIERVRLIMKRDRGVAGLGGIVFAVLVVVALSVANPQGGTYDVADVSRFVAEGHRNAAIASSALIALAVAGLVALMAYVSATYLEGGQRGRIAWGSSLLAAGSFLIGWVVILAPSLTVSVGGGPAIEPAVSYTFIETGFGIFLVGGLLLGVALLTFAVFGETAPTWARVLTGLVGVLALFSGAFDPFLAVLLWSLIIGLWLLVSSLRAGAPATAAVRA